MDLDNTTPTTEQVKETAEAVVDATAEAATEAANTVNETATEAADTVSEAASDAATQTSDAVSNATSEALSLLEPASGNSTSASDVIAQLGESSIYLMGFSFILGSLFTILVLILLDFMRRKSND